MSCFGFSLSLAYILVVGLLLAGMKAVFRPTDIAIAVIAVYLDRG